MTFEYKDKLINILDTPGHKDFAEDTYRTLTAVDSVILVIDCVKGVEEQTEKLMEVCRMRDTPVIVFVNKMDRDGKDPFDLLDELEKKLNIHVQPLSWPIGKGTFFKGVYNIPNQSLNLFTPSQQKLTDDNIKIDDLSSKDLDAQVGTTEANQLREDIELIHGVYSELDREAYLAGQIAPVYFGSAVNNFGIQELLETFVELAPNPRPRPTSVRDVAPTENKFSGFVFKIHANLDPKHRDRIAFMRICSGEFKRNKFYFHVRNEKELRFNNPTTFMASQKNIIEEAYPGDVVGLYDSGNFKIGDTLTEGEKFYFKGIPNFSPEIFKEIINLDPMKTKQLQKGLEQLTDEGVAQLFRSYHGSFQIVGTVGELQFEVIQYRLEHEYGAKCRMASVNYHKACWMTGEEKKIEEFIKFKSNNVFFDKDENKVFMAESSWLLDVAIKDYPNITFHTTSEFKI